MWLNMDEFGNMKSSHFKGETLPATMTPVQMFPGRQLQGPSHPFQNAPMPSPYRFSMESTLIHHSDTSFHQTPPPPLHTNMTNVSQRQHQLQDVRPITHAYSKSQALSFHTYSSFMPGNAGPPASGFYNMSPHSGVPKHSYENVLSASTQPSFHGGAGNDAQMVGPKPHYPAAPPYNVAMTGINHLSEEPSVSYSQELRLAQNSAHPAHLSKELQKAHENVTSIQIMGSDNDNASSSETEGGARHCSTTVTSGAGSQNQSTSGAIDILSKLSGGKTYYKCGLCGLKLSSNEALLGHVNTHTELMPYTCGFCGVSFVEGRQLTKHVQYSHDVKAPYACGICDEIFYQNTDLEKHVENHDETLKTRNGNGSHTKAAPGGEDRNAAENSSADLNARDKDVEFHVRETEDDESGENSDPREPVAWTWSNSSIVVINKDTNFNLRKEPSKIVTDDVDLNAVCTVIVEPSTAGGARKKHLFKCNFCEKVCKDKGSLVSHVRTHTKARPYECNVCGAKFKQYAHLSDHILTKHTKDRPFVCDQCAKAFNRKSHLQDHIRLRHTEDKLYHCTECPLTFQKRAEFSEHKRSHERPPKYQCSMCPRQFRNVTDFERHVRSHTKEKRFACEICHLTFGLLANAKKHMIKHQEERPFKCDVCPKAYHFEHDFKRHKLTHLKKKPFPCPDCYKSFKSAALLKKHAKDAHTKVEVDPDKPFQCLKCNKCFKTRWYLNKHKKVHSKMKISSTSTFLSNNSLSINESKDVTTGSDVEENSLATPGKRSKGNSRDGSVEARTDVCNLPKPRRRPHKRKTENCVTVSVSGNKSRARTKKRSQISIKESDLKRNSKLRKISHGEKNGAANQFLCCDCNKSFKSKSLLIQHSLIHVDEGIKDEIDCSDSESKGDSPQRLSKLRPNKNSILREILEQVDACQSSGVNLSEQRHKFDDAPSENGVDEHTASCSAERGECTSANLQRQETFEGSVEGKTETNAELRGEPPSST